VPAHAATRRRPARTATLPRVSHPVMARSTAALRINLGAGPDRRAGWTNVDIDPAHEPDVVWDLNTRPYPFEDGSACNIYGAQLLEHLTLHCIEFFQEAHRILDSDGTLELVLPNMFSLANRARYVVGRIETSPEWNPYHMKLVHPRYLLALARHVGFDARLAYNRLPWLPWRYLGSGSLWIVARKRR
jgi:predicted SAM-dependent methyltransferase